MLLQHYLVEHHADGCEVIRRREEKDGLPPGRDRLASPYDLDARWAAKGTVTWSGYKLHLTETCDDPPELDADDTAARHSEPPNLITAVFTTPATEPDSLAVEPVHAQLAEHGLLPGEHYLDSGYPSVEGVVAARAEYGIQIISPLQIDHSPQAKARRGYARADFTSKANRAYLRSRKITAVIPEKVDQAAARRRRGSAGGRPVSFDPELYKLRNSVERCFNKLKQWRGIATRCDKRAESYEAAVTLASIMVWIRNP